MVEISPEAIKSNNWIQGVLLSGNERKFFVSDAEASDSFKNSDILILFSQGCDLVNPDLSKEPFAEFFCAKTISGIRPEYAFGKNPRVIHLESNQGRFLKIDINRRMRINRGLLTKVKLNPDNEKLNQEDLGILLDWFSKKYSRAAFPDTFNTILKDIRRLERQLRKFDESYPEVIRVFFRLAPEDIELLDEIPYELEIILLMKGTSTDSDDSEELEIIENKFRDILTHQRLEISRCTCLYENEMTIYDLRFYKVWDKDYISASKR